MSGSDPVSLPAVSELSPHVLETHRSAHEALDRSWRTAHPVVGRLWSRLAVRLTVEGIANVKPPLRGGREPLLFPPPRAFLSATDRRRLAGARTGFRHVDSRLAMVRQGYEAPPALLPETPYVLHALVEGPVENATETNPGMVRGMEFSEEGLPASGRPIPTHDRCRVLMQDALELALSPKISAVARAGWLFYQLGEIHPFQDGNGRVVRLLYLIVTGEDMPETLDWGVIEQLRFHENRLMEAAKSPQPGPTVAVATELSTTGAHLMGRRLAVLGAVVPELAHRLGLDLHTSVLALAVWLRRAASLADVAEDVDRPYAEALARARAMEASGLFRRHLGPRADGSSAPVYSLAPGLVAELMTLMKAAVAMNTSDVDVLAGGSEMVDGAGVLP